MDATVRGGCAARSVIAVSMLRGPPVVTGVRRPGDGTTRGVRTPHLALILIALTGVLALAACGEEAGDAVDRARSQANAALDQAGLSDDLDRAQARVDDLVDDAQDATGARLDQAKARARRAIRDARADVERQIREARREGATDEEVDRLRREARERLDDLGDRVDEALTP